MKKYSSTKKANYRRTPPRSKYWWLSILTGLILLSWIFPWFITNLSSAVLYPFNAVSGWMRTSDSFIPEYLRSKNELLSEIDQLKAQIATENSTRNTVNRLLDENMRLRGMTNSGLPSDRLTARVTARPTKLAYDLLQIDRGSDDGVKVGSPVYTGVDTIIGVVVHTSPRSAFVDLMTSPGFESSAYIIGPNVFAPLEGIGGGVARVRLPQGIDIKPDQLVILPSVSGGVFGQIVSVENLPTQPEQYGYIVPPQAISGLFHVSVGLDVIEVRSESEIEAEIQAATRAKLLLDEGLVASFEEKMKAKEEAEADSGDGEEGDQEAEGGVIEEDQQGTNDTPVTGSSSAGTTSDENDQL